MRYPERVVKDAAAARRLGLRVIGKVREAIGVTTSGRPEKPPRRRASVVQSLAIRSHGESRPTRKRLHGFSQSLPLGGKLIELPANEWKGLAEAV